MMDIADRIRPHRLTNGPVMFRDPNVLREAADEIVRLAQFEPAIWKGACISQVLSELPKKVREQIPESVRLKLACLVTPPTMNTLETENSHVVRTPSTSP